MSNADPKPSPTVEAPEGEAVIVMTRIFAAPRETVWEAFTRPEHVKQWYGGHGFKNPVCEMDVRPGGRWRHVMRTPDGLDHALQFVFVEVVKPERLSWQDADYDTRAPGGGAPPCRHTVTLDDLDGRTRWRLVSRFRSLTERRNAQSMGFVDMLTQGVARFEILVRRLGGARSIEKVGSN